MYVLAFKRGLLGHLFIFAFIIIDYAYNHFYFMQGGTNTVAEITVWTMQDISVLDCLEREGRYAPLFPIQVSLERGDEPPKRGQAVLELRVDSALLAPHGVSGDAQGALLGEIRGDQVRNVACLREDIFARIYHHEEIYPPPIEGERGSLFLDVTSGCRYGKCLFCDFRRDAFEVYGLEDARRQLALLRQVAGAGDRMHFLGCNPFFLDTEVLLALRDLVGEFLPQVSSLNMYARAEDVNAKTDDELRALREADITELHVGLESGSDAVLAFHNKGETAQEIETALNRLERAGILYHVTMIPGLGGRYLSWEHAVKTAAMLSRLHPETIWCLSLKLWEKTPLYRLAQKGEFEPLTPMETLLEEREMVSRMNMTRPCRFIDSTVLQKYTISANLPKGKSELLRAIDQLLALET